MVPNPMNSSKPPPKMQESIYSGGNRAFKSLSLNDRRPVDSKTGQVKAMNGKC